jgi:hypothetical protein
MAVRLPSTLDPIDQDKRLTRAQADFERATRALEHFYRIRPNLEALVRVFTQNKDAVVLPTGGASATDGKAVWVRVNIEWGDRYRHDPEKCDKRDARDQLLCSACLRDEGILVPLFHEIAHIIYDSFEKMSDADKQDAIEQTLAEAERFGIKGKRLDGIRSAMSKRLPESYVEAAARISPYLHPILNSLEDARVNALTMEARRGMRVMFGARAVRIFEQGIEEADGSIRFWRDAPLNAQAIIGLFCEASGYDWAGWFEDAVEEALNDDRLKQLVSNSVSSGSAAGVYRYGFPILERLRELGFCRVPDEPDDDEEEEVDEGDASQGGSGEGSPPSFAFETDDADDPDAKEQEPQQSGSESGDGQGDGTADDDDTDDGADGADGADSTSQDDADEPNEADGTGDTGDDAEDDTDDRGASDGADDEDADADEESEGGSDTEEDEGDDAGDESGGSNEGSSQVGGDTTPEPQPEMGTPDEVIRFIKTFGEHEDEDEDDHDEDEPEEDVDEEIERAIVQHRDFDEPSLHVHETRVLDEGKSLPYRPILYRNEFDVVPLGEPVIQRSLGKLRKAFSENRKSSERRNLKSGRLDAKVLGRRIPTGDDRLYKKRKRPGKRDYFVVIGVDVSGSTVQGRRLSNIKSAAFAQAELLSRVGVDFEIWAHTADQMREDAPGGDRWMLTDVYRIKSVNERWNSETKERLSKLQPSGYNLDGHTFEFYRKRLDKSRATDRLLMYYTDGDMPYANFKEELRILQRELRICKRRGYEVVGVGFQTDSPKAHGLDTVRIDGIQDVPKVVDELYRRLAQ